MSDIEKLAKEFIISRSDNAPFLMAIPPEHIVSELLEECNTLRKEVGKSEEAFKLQWFMYKDLEKEAIELHQRLEKCQEVVEVDKRLIMHIKAALKSSIKNSFKGGVMGSSNLTDADVLSKLLNYVDKFETTLKGE